ncbi:STAS domain-containing protein [Streptomyces sp. NPDC013953]|uniref:STAS domain-containing protein n=1 Tax=Streptomyces sp. NPDC013953 TaxID=3364868 RepID=UPI0036FFA05A
MDEQISGGADQGPEVTEPRLAVVAATAGDIPVLRVSGDLDLTTVPVLMDAVNASVRAHGRRRIVLDCADLEFCDSSGLNCFLQLHQGTGPVEGVVLAQVGATVRRLLDITGVDAALTVVPTVETAVARLRT